MIEQILFGMIISLLLVGSLFVGLLLLKLLAIAIELLAFAYHMTFHNLLRAYKQALLEVWWALKDFKGNWRD